MHMGGREAGPGAPTLQARKNGRALVVDDELYIREILTASLEDAGWSCVAVENAAEALERLAKESFDIVLTDIRMPGKSGTELLQEIRAAHPEVYVIMTTGLDSVDSVIEAVRHGAYDYILKPFNLEQVQLSAGRALERRRIEIESREYQRYLQQVAEERAAETRRLFYAMTRVLVRLFELKSPYKSGHPLKVAEMSRHVAHQLRLTEDGVRKVFLAALLADVGMIGIHDQILAKADPLTEDEYRKLKDHIQMTEEVLRPILDDEEVLKYIRHHHERFDGSGYPDGLRGNLIPLGSRIITVVESFVAMTQDRPYRDPLSPEAAVRELFRCSESQFDPHVVAVFAELNEQIFRNMDQSSWGMP